MDNVVWEFGSNRSRVHLTDDGERCLCGETVPQDGDGRAEIVYFGGVPPLNWERCMICAAQGDSDRVVIAEAVHA